MATYDGNMNAGMAPFHRGETDFHLRHADQSGTTRCPKSIIGNLLLKSQ